MSRQPWRPGDVVGHNDAGPNNAVWEPVTADASDSTASQRLVGFVDWDFAAPCPPLYGLAFVVFSWVLLHARDLAAADGFTRHADRPRRLRLLLDAYGYPGQVSTLLEVIRTRIDDHIEGLRQLAATGDPLFVRLLDDGVPEALERALVQLDEDAPTFYATKLAEVWPRCWSTSDINCG